MVHSFSRWLTPAALFAAAWATAAQTAPSPARPDPLDPKAHVPALVIEPSFAKVRRPGDEGPVSWREANDTVARVGGWRVYAREAQQPEPTPPAPPTQPPSRSDLAKPMPHGQGGHKTP